MKRTKKILAALLLLSLLAALGACGGGAAQPSAEPSAEPEAATGGKLVMATNAEFPPYEYHEGGEIVGIDAEIAAKIAQELGMELEISDMEFDSLIPAVQTGKADFAMAGMTVTEDRLLEVNFSDSYAKGIQVIIIPEGSDITGPDDLPDKKIGVQLSTTGDIYARDDYGDDFVTSYSKGADAVMALKQGKVDCVIIDNEPAKAFVAANEGLAILDTEYVEEDYAIAVAKENEDLLEKINGALEKLTADGTVQSILDKYITSD